MSTRDILTTMGMRAARGAETFEAAMAADLYEFWNRICDVAREQPQMFSGAQVEWIVRHLDARPSGAFTALLNLAGRDPGRAAGLCRTYRDLLARHPKEGLASAGYNLHEYNHLLDDEWIAAARGWYDENPEGAWGIMSAAGMYRASLLTPATIAWFEDRAEGHPENYARMLFGVADRDEARREEFLRKAVAAIDRFPGPALAAAATCARQEAHLSTGPVIDAVIRHLDANPEKAWEFLSGASYAVPAALTEERLDAMERNLASGAKSLYAILARVAAKSGDRARAALDRYARLLPARPYEAIEALYYLSHNETHLLRQDLVDGVAAHFSANPYHAFDVLRRCLDDRPELIQERHLEAGVANIAEASNWAFGFFKAVLQSRPEFAPIATVALFECLGREPQNRAGTREEEIDAIVAVAQASHVKTELERLLRMPPSAGSRRARALMAILFRQTSRSKQYVLLEALRFVATAAIRESGLPTPLWDFLMFLLDESGDDAVSTAAAERFLEGAFQLHYLMDRGADHDEFRRRFDPREPAAEAWPGGAEFLQRDEPLTRLYRVVATLSKRLGRTLRLRPIEEFARRAMAAEIELQQIEALLEGAEGKRRERLEERVAALNRQLSCWINPEYARAFGDPEAEKRLGEEARKLLARERRDLTKHLRDTLRAELTRLAVEGVDGSRMDLYRKRLRSVLGRDVDISRIEPSILPSFLFFSSLGDFPNNRKYLARLIEDRLEKRPHDWLRTEPPAAEWAARVRAARPGIRLDRWRAPFSKEFAYRPRDAAEERRRRVKADLAQARDLLEKAGATGIARGDRAELEAKLAELRAPAPEPEAEEKTPRRDPPDPRLLDEVETNLRRVRIVEDTPVTDFEGTLTLSVETDPFEILFMGEYGFASCLSLRGRNVWSAVSNAIDVDKAIVWAKEPGGNVVGRRLLALLPQGLLSYRTYTNRHGLALDPLFSEFVDALAAHVGTVVIHEGSPGALLSDQWYDDGAV
jgi:hypothetical protein